MTDTAINAPDLQLSVRTISVDLPFDLVHPSSTRKKPVSRVPGSIRFTGIQREKLSLGDVHIPVVIAQNKLEDVQPALDLARQKGMLAGIAWIGPKGPTRGSARVYIDGRLAATVNANLSGNPGTRGLTYEAFWMPIEFSGYRYVRIGVQYTAYSKFNGASSNYDGMGRDAKDNNSLFFYIWGAY